MQISFDNTKIGEDAYARYVITTLGKWVYTSLFLKQKGKPSYISDVTCCGFSCVFFLCIALSLILVISARRIRRCLQLQLPKKAVLSATLLAALVHSGRKSI